jgi:hypothetical protein
VPATGVEYEASCHYGQLELRNLRTLTEYMVMLQRERKLSSGLHTLFMSLAKGCFLGNNYGTFSFL